MCVHSQCVQQQQRLHRPCYCAGVTQIKQFLNIICVTHEVGHWRVWGDVDEVSSTRHAMQHVSYNGCDNEEGKFFLFSHSRQIWALCIWKRNILNACVMRIPIPHFDIRVWKLGPFPSLLLKQVSHWIGSKAAWFGGFWVLMNNYYYYVVVGLVFKLVPIYSSQSPRFHRNELLFMFT